jgi:magnesium-transporting ATPase (P-type)
MRGEESTLTPINPQTVDAVRWHSQPVEEVYTQLQTNPDGLDQSEAAARLQQFGPNTLPAPKPPALWQVILHQFASPLIYILLIAGVVSLLIGDFKDAVFIFVVLVLNATIGTIQEWRAEQQAHALQNVLKIQADVRRNGRQTRLPAEELVPGDIVLIESGDKVPADLRLVQVNNLTIDESFLTGESVAVEKEIVETDEDTPVSDRHNMAYAGSTTMTGRGVGVVVATGVQTEVGKIARSITETESAKPPLLIRMDRFARQVSFVILGASGLLGLLMLSRSEPFGEVFFLVIALAVASIPEGLPVALTVALSLSASRMAQRNVIVRKLAAVESLGSCTTIASDKTGTLTVNQQTVKKIVLPDGEALAVGGQGYNDQGEVRTDRNQPPGDNLRQRLDALVMASVICNEATLSPEDGDWRHTGDAMDVALLALAYKYGCNPEEQRERARVIGAIPFESERRYAATAYVNDSKAHVAVKGAVEAILPFCTTMRTATDNEPLDEEQIHQQAHALAEDGYRVLAVASGALDLVEENRLEEDDLCGLTFLGLVGFIDPLRPEVKQAVKGAQDAGVRVIMITGDHPSTALAIARELGIAQDAKQVVTGKDLDKIDAYGTPKFQEAIKDVLVFARVTPQQKLHIVDALVKMGEFVAVTGDGVNDAPALRVAHIGVAMGSGTDIAKETALITIVDDNFASIVAGIEEGRFAYANVRKVTLFLISTGAAQVLLIGAIVLLGSPVPLLPAQILWLNLVTNGIQDVALAFEAGEKGVMKQPPRHPSEGIINRKMLEQVLVSSITMSVTCFIAWLVMLNMGMDIETIRYHLLTLLVLMQFYYVLSCRSETVSAFRVPLRNNPVLIFGMAVAFVIYVLATELPLLQELLRTESMPLQTWLLFGVSASVVIIAMEVYKWIQNRRAQTA